MGDSLRGDFVVIGDKFEYSEKLLSYFIAAQMLKEIVPLMLSQSTDFTLSYSDLR